MDNNLKKQILDLIENKYVNIKQEFIEGKTFVNYAGRIFDKNEILSLVSSSLDFWLTYGQNTKIFEKQLCSFLNIKYSLFVNSGSSANLLAFFCLTSNELKERKINRGDEIITVAACFPTTISPIIQYGAIPVFVDIDYDTCNIDVNMIEQAITKKTKAIIIAHTLGNPFDIDKIVSICKKYNLWLIQDNCDALGSEWNCKKTGTFGDIGTSSFYPAHHITTGQGGAVYTNNSLLYKIMKSMRDWGRDCICDSGCDNTCNHRFNYQYGKLPFGYDHKYVYSNFGFNLKGTDLQASIGVQQLKKLPKFIQDRKNNWLKYYDNLKQYDCFEFMKKLPNSNPSWFGFIIKVKEKYNFNKNNIVKYLQDKKIQTRSLFSGNIIKHPCFDNLILNKDYRIFGDLKNTDRIMNNTFWIGVYSGITKEKSDYIINTIKEFYNEHC